MEFHRDRGWAWVISFAGFVIFAVQRGLGNVIGLLVIEIVKEFNATSSQLSLIFGVRDAIDSISALFTLGVMNDFVHTRVQIMLGGLFFFIGFSLCFFADSLLHYYCYAIFIGMGTSLVWCQAVVLVNEYFHKHKTLATGIVTSGTGIGTVTLPFLIKYLLGQYSLRGTMLIIGAISLHIFVCGCLMRPIEFNTRNRIVEYLVTQKQSAHGLLEINESNARHNSSCGEMSHVGTVHTSNFPNIAISEDSTLYSIDETVSLRNELNCHDKNERADLTPRMFSTYMTRTKQFREFFVRNSSKRKQFKIIDFDLLKNTSFMSYQIGAAMFQASIGVECIFRPSYASETNSNLNDISILICVYGIFNSLSRYVQGVLGDSGLVQRYKLGLFYCFMMGIVCNMARFFSGFWPHVVFHALSGFGIGSFLALHPVIVIDFFGRDVHARSLGITVLLAGVFKFIMAPAIGYTRDLTGSYAASFNVIGSTYLLGCAVWLFVTVPLLNRNRRSTTAQQCWADNTGSMSLNIVGQKPPVSDHANCTPHSVDEQ